MYLHELEKIRVILISYKYIDKVGNCADHAESAHPTIPKRELHGIRVS